MQSGPEQLTAWMKKRGFNLAETSEFLGFDQAFVSKILNGHRSPGRSNAIRIEDRTGISVRSWESSEEDKPDTVEVENTRKRR